MGDADKQKDIHKPEEADDKEENTTDMQNDNQNEEMDKIYKQRIETLKKVLIVLLSTLLFAFASAAGLGFGGNCCCGCKNKSDLVHNVLLMIELCITIVGVVLDLRAYLLDAAFIEKRRSNKPIENEYVYVIKMIKGYIIAVSVCIELLVLGTVLGIWL